MSDSLFAINAISLGNAKKPFHQALADDIRKQVSSLRLQSKIVTFTKIAAHLPGPDPVNAGNHAADILAGLAATGTVIPPTVKAEMPTLENHSASHC